MSESEKPVTMESYIKLCAIIFTLALGAIGCMIWVSFLPHYSWTAKLCFILAIATGNAFLVAGYLMHLLSEKKLVYSVLACTVFFVIGLAGLTIWAMNDFPTNTAVH